MQTEVLGLKKEIYCILLSFFFYQNCILLSINKLLMELMVYIFQYQAICALIIYLFFINLYIRTIYSAYIDLSWFQYVDYMC